MKTPFDLIDIVIHHIGGSTVVQMRPFQFDSELVDYDKMLNHFGELVKPTKCAATCPGCGSYLEISTDNLDDEYEKKCMACYVPPKLPKILVPFQDPPPNNHLSCNS